MMISVATIVTALIACVFDVRTRRIPNALTLSAALAGLLFHCVADGRDGAFLAMAGWVIGLLIFFPLFALRGMGGGDVKLLAALGAWVGPREVVWLAVYTGIAGGVIGVGVALSRGYLKTAMHNIFGALLFWSSAGFQPVPGMTLESKAAPRLAYAIPILAGTLVTLWP